MSRQAAGGRATRHCEKHPSKKRNVANAATKQHTLISAAAKKGDLVARDPVHMLSSLATELQISDRTEKKALEIYGRIRSRKLDRGRPSFAFAAASLYAACRVAGSVNSLKEISKGSGIEITAVARIYRLLLNELDLKVTITDPAKCVSIVADKAGLKDKKTTALALQILKDRGVAHSRAGKDPMGFAATALYMACVRNGCKTKTQKEIAEAAGVTEVTIRHRSNEIKSVIEAEGLI